MKIETIRDPIPTYDRTTREELQARRARLSQTVSRDKEPANKRREQESSAKERSEDQEEQQAEATSTLPFSDGPPAHGTPQNRGSLSGNALDVVV